jgi:hypothetical protein
LLLNNARTSIKKLFFRKNPDANIVPICSLNIFASLGSNRPNHQFLTKLVSPTSRIHYMSIRFAKLLPLMFALDLVLFPIPLFAARVSWIGGSGDWNTATNWSTDALPGTIDDVVINAGTAITVTISSGTHVVKSILSQQTFVLSGGTLSVLNTMQVNNNFNLSGGTLSGAIVLQGTNGGSLIVQNQNAILSGVTVNGILDVGNSYNDSALTITNGLVLEGTALVGNSTNSNFGAINFAGSQTLSGNGTVVFGDYSDDYIGECNRMQIIDRGTTLTISPGIMVAGNIGVIGGGSDNVAVINQGTIGANVYGGNICVQGAWLLNQGLLSADDGGRITVYANLTNTGAFNATNSIVTLGGMLTLADLGTFKASETTVYLVGTLNNTTTTLAIDALGGTWVLNGGEIDGGLITTTNSSGLVIDGSGTLDGVMLKGNLDVGNRFENTGLTITNGLVLNGTVLVGNRTNSTFGEIHFVGVQTLSGSGAVFIGNTFDAALLRYNCGLP